MLKRNLVSASIAEAAVDPHHQRLCRKLSVDQVLHEQPPSLGKEETLLPRGRFFRGAVAQGTLLRDLNRLAQ
jgi:hypothetical protein